MLTSDTFTIRQDRTVRFDPTQLTFTFAGTSAQPSPSSAAIGSVKFVENRGRPGHVATATIQGDDPPVGAQLGLSAEIYGAVNAASFNLLATNGALLSQGALSEVLSGTFFSAVTIPAQPFQVKVVATSATGLVSSFTSKLYRPAVVSIDIQIEDALLDKGQSVSLKVVVNSTGAQGAYKMGLLLPVGFSAKETAWTVNLTPGKSVEVSTTLVAPIDASTLSFHTLLVTLVNSLPPLDSWNSSLKVVVH